MEKKENLKMSNLEGNDLKEENAEGFDDNENNFNEKTSLVSRQHSADFDSESESPPSNTKTIDMDRSLYMENTLSFFSAMIHIIKSSLGIGMLGLPFAVMNAGLVVGPLMIFLTGVLVLHCMHLLVESSHAFCDRSKHMYLDYAKVAEMALDLYHPKRKSLGKLLVNAILLITQLGFCCVYLIFVAESLRQIFSAVFLLDAKVWVAILLVPVILLSFIRTLKVMAVVSAVSVILYIAGIFCLLVYACQTIKTPVNLPSFVGFGSMPLAFGSIVFAFEAIGVILPVENMMTLPGKFRQVVNGAMCLVISMSMLLGTLGYLSCGKECLGSFTLNLPNTVFGDIVKMMFALAILFTYFIQFYVPMTIILPPLKEKVNEKYHNLTDYGVRTLLVCLTAILAVSIPQLGNMISLVGSFGSVSLAITFPALIHLAVLHNDKELDKLTFAKDVLIIMVGFLGTVAGIFASIFNIIWTFEHEVDHNHHLANSTMRI